MSSYLVIAAVSEALRQILWEEFSADSRIARQIQSREEIALKNPTEAAKDASHKLSLWLYDISENPFRRNDTSHRAEGKEFPALPLNLHYLLTPLSVTGEADHVLIGKSMQVLSGNPTVFLRDELDDIHEELRVMQSRLSIEEMSQIWNALQEPYRLSMCYEVRAARVDSERALGDARVIERIFPMQHGIRATT